MTEFITFVIVGAVVAFVLPPFVPARFRSWLIDIAIRSVGILIIVGAVLSTSFVTVPDGHLAQIFRVIGGGPLSAGRIVAVKGENGPQARILTPGFHIEFLVNVINSVSTASEETNIPIGKIGILVAKDGSPLRAGQTF